MSKIYFEQIGNIFEGFCFKVKAILEATENVMPFFFIRQDQYPMSRLKLLIK